MFESLSINKIKASLNCSSLHDIVCRDKECNEIENFLNDHIQQMKSTSLYISGAPGTGKTASLDFISKKIENNFKTLCLSYNAMIFRNANDFFTELINDLKIKTKARQTMDQKILLIEKVLTQSKKMILLILDEIDKLDSKNHEILHIIFDWPRIPKSKLIVIGIANTMNLTSQSLARMNVSEKTAVKHINFRPYTKDQLVAIIENRLSQISSSKEFFDKSALEMCARKVSSQSGDARKALDVCRRALEIVEQENKCNFTSSNFISSNRGIKSKSPLKDRQLPNDQNATKVELKHVIKVINQLYGSKLSSFEESYNLTIQQQIILWILLNYSKERKTEDIEIGKCHQLFVKICLQTGISYDVISPNDFFSICEILESNGLIFIKRLRECRYSKLRLTGNEEEMKYHLKDKSMARVINANLSSIL